MTKVVKKSAAKTPVRKAVQIVVEDTENAKTPVVKLVRVKTTRSAIKKSTPHPKKNVFAPANDKSSPKAQNGLAANPFTVGTPQMADPIAMLKLNLKNKLQEKIEEKVSKMPQT